MHNATFVLSRRTALLGGIAVLVTTTAAAPRPPRVLFVCDHGTVKSLIARELMRRRAKQRNIAVEVRSRGVAPQPAPPPELAQALARDGIDVRREPVRRMTRPDAAWADIMVHFIPLSASLAAREKRDWGDTLSPISDYAAALTQLSGRIDLLLDELAPRLALSTA